MMIQSASDDSSRRNEGTVEEDEEDYVTLAKAGGRKDLLVFQEFVRASNHDEPTPYPWVDWFDHPIPPSLQATDNGPSYTPSNLLMWKPRPEQCHKNKKHEPMHLPSIRQRKLTYPLNKPTKIIKRKHAKLPSIPSGPILMKQLMSMDYQKEWLERNNHRIAEEKRKQKERKKLQEEKLLQHSMKTRKVIGTEEERDKDRFIMKKFQNIPSKLKLPSIVTREPTTVTQEPTTKH